MGFASFYSNSIEYEVYYRSACARERERQELRKMCEALHIAICALKSRLIWVGWKRTLSWPVIQLRSNLPVPSVALHRRPRQSEPKHVLGHSPRRMESRCALL